MIRRDTLKLTTSWVGRSPQVQKTNSTAKAVKHFRGDAAVAYPIQGLPDLRSRAGK